MISTHNGPIRGSNRPVLLALVIFAILLAFATAQIRFESIVSTCQPSNPQCPPDSCKKKFTVEKCCKLDEWKDDKRCPVTCKPSDTPEQCCKKVFDPKKCCDKKGFFDTHHCCLLDEFQHHPSCKTCPKESCDIVKHPENCCKKEQLFDPTYCCTSKFYDSHKCCKLDAPYFDVKKCPCHEPQKLNCGETPCDYSKTREHCCKKVFIHEECCMLTPKGYYDEDKCCNAYPHDFLPEKCCKKSEFEHHKCCKDDHHPCDKCSKAALPDLHGDELIECCTRNDYEFFNPVYCCESRCESEISLCRSCNPCLKIGKGNNYEKCCKNLHEKTDRWEILRCCEFAGVNQENADVCCDHQYFDDLCFADQKKCCLHARDTPRKCCKGDLLGWLEEFHPQVADEICTCHCDTEADSSASPSGSSVSINPDETVDIRTY